MTSINEYLKTADRECYLSLSGVRNRANEAMQPIADQLTQNSINNIPQEFGEFLYASLGDRVNSQTISVINNTYMEQTDVGKKIVEGATAKGVTVEEYMRNEEWVTAWYYKPQTFLTTGRKFGVSNYTPSRTHTLYFGAGSCFTYLTQEHVDCVKDAEKRKCTQSFLDFRNDFVSSASSLAHKLIEVNIPVKLGITSTLDKRLARNSHGFDVNSERNHYRVMDEIVDSTITHVIATINTVPVWDKTAYLYSHSCPDHVNYPNYVSLIFLNISHNNNVVTIIGNADISCPDGGCSSAVKYDDEFYRWNTVHLSGVGGNYTDEACGFLKTPAFEGHAQDYSDYKLSKPLGILMNIHEVLEHPQIKTEFDKRIKFYTDMSDRFQQLKHEFAALYFVNGDM